MRELNPSHGSTKKLPIALQVFVFFYIYKDKVQRTLECMRSDIPRGRVTWSIDPVTLMTSSNMRTWLGPRGRDHAKP